MGVTADSADSAMRYAHKLFANFPPGKKRFTIRIRHHARLPPFRRKMPAPRSHQRCFATPSFRKREISAAFGSTLTNTFRAKSAQLESAAKRRSLDPRRRRNRANPGYGRIFIL